MNFENTEKFAKHLDKEDPLRTFREKFYIPILHGKECIYLTGNSLGLQPKTVQDYVTNELEDWANYGVEGHVQSRIPWMSYHEIFPARLSKIIGALPEEIVVMNQLTVNLHLLLTTFYRPTKERYKILMEAKAFPSDQYAVESQVKLHGYDPAEAIIEVKPREGEFNIRKEDILQAIEENANTLSVVLIGGVNYYTGQVFDMKAITAAAHAAGAYAGFDLAHAVGNIELELHNWNVDFASWCSYKYLNSGPGAVAGVYIHQNHVTNTELPRLAGWWGNDKATRFQMEKEFHPMPTAEGWQLSNAPILSMAVHSASLDVFEEAGFDLIITKGTLLSNYLLFIIDEINKSAVNPFIEIITPREESEKGCQVSLLLPHKGKEFFETLKSQSIIADWREPNVIRVSPVPLYNSFEDVFLFGQVLSSFIQDLN